MERSILAEKKQVFDVRYNLKAMGLWRRGEEVHYEACTVVKISLHQERNSSYPCQESKHNSLVTQPARIL